jgi:hypothetical protein
MYTVPVVRSEECASVPGVAWARAPEPFRQKQSIVRRLLAWRWGQSARCRDFAWKRVASLQIGQAVTGSGLNWTADRNYRFIKLRALSVDVQVRRLAVEFSNGSLQDLSIGMLLRGSESLPIRVGQSEAKGILMEYRAGPGARGEVEVWAHD